MQVEKRILKNPVWDLILGRKHVLRRTPCRTPHRVGRFERRSHDLSENHRR